MRDRLLARFGWLFRRRAAERELEEELRYHIERQTELHVREGTPEAEARRRATLELGGLAQVKENCRDVRGLVFAETLAQDVRYALRAMRRDAGFTAVALLSLALGIGANTALFSVLKDALLAALPVRNPAELAQVLLVWPSGATVSNLDYPETRPLAEGVRGFSSVLAFSGRDVNLRTAAGSERARADLVSGSYYATLGVDAVLGRTITESDDRPGAPPVAVLAYPYWKRRFALDPGVIGKTIYLEGAPFTIVGVTPPGFYGTDRMRVPDIAVPMSAMPNPGYWYIIGRLRPGVSLEQTRTELSVRLTDTIESYTAAHPNWSPRDRQRALGLKVKLQRAGIGDWRLQLAVAEPLRVLFLLAGVILLIACTNVANLLLGRAAARSREMAVRLALGAGRARLVRQLLTESLLLSAASGAAGLAVAFGFHRVLTAFLGFGSRAQIGFRPDLWVLSFTAAVSVAAGTIFGTAPAFRATRTDVGPALKGRSPQTGRSFRIGPARALVVVQVAATLVLLGGAALFVRSLRNLRLVDSGFDREHLLVMSVDARESHIAREQLAGEMTRRVLSLPGVRGAGLAATYVFPAGGYNKSVWVHGYGSDARQSYMVNFNHTGPGFFAAAGIPLVAGRDFVRLDCSTGPPVAIVNEAFARRFFPDQNPLGRRFGDKGVGSSGKYEIVGVVKDARHAALRNPAPPVVFQPLLPAADPRRSWVLHVRAYGRPGSLAAAVRRELQALDASLAVYDVRTMSEVLDSALRRERMFATLSSLFGLLAAGLSCVGLYGMAAYSVVRRTPEIGIRVALGAARGDILRMIFRETLTVVVLGLAAGIPAALALSGVARKLLFEVSPADPASLIAAAAVLALVAAAAGWMPARRASRIEPVAALRYE